MERDKDSAQAAGIVPGRFVLFREANAEPLHREKLRRVVLQLASAPDGPLSDTEKQAVEHGLEEVLELPPADRSLDALRAAIAPESETASARVAKYCSGGALSWVFENGPEGPSIEERLLDFDVGNFHLLEGKHRPVDLDEFWRCFPGEANRLDKLMASLSIPTV